MVMRKVTSSPNLGDLTISPLSAPHHHHVPLADNNSPPYSGPFFSLSNSMQTLPSSRSGSGIKKKSSTIVTPYPRSPHTLVESCLHQIVRNFQKYTSFPLPNELILKIVGLLIKKHKLNDAALAKLLSPSMQVLSLNGFTDNINIRLLSSRLGSVQSLLLSGCLLVSDSTLQQFAMYCTALRKLDISYSKRVTDEGIVTMSKMWTQLCDLDLSWCRRLSDKSLFALGTCERLEKMNLSRCRNITGKGVEAVVAGCTNLKFLDLKGCVMIEGLSLRSSSLRSLNLSGCEALNDLTIRSISCPYLDTLLLSGCKTISDPTLEALLRSSPALNVLDLSYSNVSGADLASVSLTSLNLSGCKNITEEVLKRIASGCPRLSKLELRDCESVTDSFLRHFDRRCGSLTSVDLSRCTKRTDEGIGALLRSCGSIRHLDLSWCDQISESTLIRIPASRLKSLKLFGCSKLSAGPIDRLKRSCPWLDVRFVASPRDWATVDSI